VRELGGLCIFGTERHESRRIDNQLRGRCGRQGDPGTTRFYVSLEDEVARLFGGDRVKRMLDFFGSQEIDDEPLSQRMVSRSIERAQRQVEEHNFEIRKHLLDYDLVMDKQRKYIYAMRRDVLQDHDITARLEEMFENLIEDALEEGAPRDKLPEDWDIDGMARKLRGHFDMDFRFEPEEGEAPKELSESLREQAISEYRRREALLSAEIQASYREQVGGDDSHIDFGKIARRRTQGLELGVLLKIVDDKWIDHLYQMDYLRDSVRLRAFGQRDPLLEYKQEGFEMFEAMIRTIEETVTQLLFRYTDPASRRPGPAAVERRDPFQELQEYSYAAADKEADSSFSSSDTSRFVLGGQAGRGFDEGGGSARAAEEEKPKHQPIRVVHTAGPNDPCPCGSGKKHKKCCGRQN
jgi:preprotein translocase subunit SecA